MYLFVCVCVCLRMQCCLLKPVSCRNQHPTYLFLQNLRAERRLDFIRWNTWVCNRFVLLVLYFVRFYTCGSFYYLVIDLLFEAYQKQLLLTHNELGCYLYSAVIQNVEVMDWGCFFFLYNPGKNFHCLKAKGSLKYVWFIRAIGTQSQICFKDSLHIIIPCQNHLIVSEKWC